MTRFVTVELEGGGKWPCGVVSAHLFGLWWVVDATAKGPIHVLLNVTMGHVGLHN